MPEMRVFNIPQTTLNASVIGFGAAGLGTRVSPNDSLQLLDLYLELGGNFLDTAHLYASWIWLKGGASEKTIGKWIASRGVRDKVIIGTKGGHPHLKTMGVPRLSRKEIERDLEESLNRLRIDTIDLYWLHRDDIQRPVGELIETLADAVAAKKIRYFGVSNWTAKRLREAQEYTRKHSLPPLAGSQVGWSLAQRNKNVGDPTALVMDDEMLAFHQETGVLAAAYSSQANGFFTGGYGRDVPKPAHSGAAGVMQAYYNDANFARLERAAELAAKHGCSPNDIALAYLTNQPFPTCAIVGCGTKEHLRESCRAGDVVLTPQEVEWLANGVRIV